MKVCTDACILGAYAAQIAKEDSTIARCLDIGAGTGLLSLMLAQQAPAGIDAIDIDVNAYEEGTSNFSLSPWQERLHYMHGDVRSYNANSPFDLIISNPPFYENELQSPTHTKNIAHHDEGLTLMELAKAVKRNLSTTGKFIVLLPVQRVEAFQDIIMKRQFHLQSKLVIRHSMRHAYTRAILVFANSVTIPSVQELIIKDEFNNYTSNFTDLLQAYYLCFDSAAK